MDQDEIAVCHPEALKLMNTFIQEMTSLTFSRALDAAAGFGRVTKDFLLDYYKQVDVFDMGPDTYKALKALQKKHDQIKLVDRATM